VTLDAPCFDLKEASVNKTRFALIAMIMASTTHLSANAGTYVVTNNNDEGAGSLRAALVDAGKADGDHVIILENAGNISINSPLRYNGANPLSIYGAGQTVSAKGNHNLLEATNGADLTVNDIHLIGPGGFSINERGDTGGVSGGKAIFVDVRDDQTGLVSLTLNNVSVSDVANHGIHISDCNLADDCGGGGGGAGEGSTASIAVRLNNVTVNNVGQGRFDADGLRVDERGEGDVHAVIQNSTFSRVGADGVEIDEGQAGSVIAHVSGSAFMNNGDYCDPAILVSLMPAADEGEFEDGQKKEADIPGPVTGSPDDGCFEREVDLYDSGYVEEYEFAIDLDDGFDIDEAGPGDLQATVIDTVIEGNLDEGLDFDEEDGGSIKMTIVGSKSMNNTDDGYKHSEEGDGSVFAHVVNSIAMANGGKGFVFEEEDSGNVTVFAQNANTSQNDDGDDTGFEVVQEDDGNGLFVVSRSSIADGIDSDGVELRD